MSYADVISDKKRTLESVGAPLPDMQESLGHLDTLRLSSPLRALTAMKHDPEEIGVVVTRMAEKVGPEIAAELIENNPGLFTLAATDRENFIAYTDRLGEAAAVIRYYHENEVLIPSEFSSPEALDETIRLAYEKANSAG